MHSEYGHSFYGVSLPDPCILLIMPNRRGKKGSKNTDYFSLFKDMAVIIDDYCHTYEVQADRFVVPAGFKTDLASIPRTLRATFPVVDTHMVAAVVHDYLYREAAMAYRGRGWADKFFLRLMKETGVPFITRHMVYRGVRAGGWLSYQKSKRKGGKK